jgi:hypothetical protein
MAVIVMFEAPGSTPEQYDHTNEILGIHGEEDAPEGLIQHVCGFTDEGILVVDVWESEESLRRFFGERANAALEEAGIPANPPRLIPVHNMIPQGAGTEANVLMIAEVEGFGPHAYDRMIAMMDAHVGDGTEHPCFSHVAGVTENGSMLVVDLWDSPESFGRFAETQIAHAGDAVGLGPIEPRFVPVYNRIRGKAPVTL